MEYIYMLLYNIYYIYIGILWSIYSKNSVFNGQHSPGTSLASQKADIGSWSLISPTTACWGMKIGMNHWPWRNSANAGLNSFRMRLELAEISKKTQNRHFLATLLAYKICMRAPKLVVPDQGENCRRRSWRHEETIDTCCTAQFVTHHEIWPKHGSYTLNK